jgi:hypothetical protein
MTPSKVCDHVHLKLSTQVSVHHGHQEHATMLVLADSVCDSTRQTAGIVLVRV